MLALKNVGRSINTFLCLPQYLYCTVRVHNLVRKVKITAGFERKSKIVNCALSAKLRLQPLAVRKAKIATIGCVSEAEIATIGCQKS